MRSRIPAVPLTEALMWTVEEFCGLHRLSVSKYYELLKAGEGPEVTYFGSLPRISREAATAWRKKMQAQSSTSS